MAISQFNLDWLTHNAIRNLPFVAEASLEDTTGSFKLPQNFIVGMNLPIHFAMNVDITRLFLSSINVFPNGYTLTIGYDNGTSTVAVASCHIVKESHRRNLTYALTGLGDFSDTSGLIAIGKLEDLDKQPAGYWQFNLEDTQIELDSIKPMIRGVQSIYLNNNDNLSAKLQGDIELVAGTNMQITPVSLGDGVTQLVFSAIAGEGTIESCICEGEETELVPITSINGIPATSDGRFYLIGDDCIQIEQTENGLKLTDSCSAPCCGSDELEAITKDLERFEQQRITQESFVDALSTSVNEFSFTVLGSRLGDRGCISCG